MEGMVVRGMMYLISFTVIFALLVLMPDKRHPFIFLGRNTMNLLFPLSHHDSDERTYDSEYSAADECLGIVRSVAAVCTDTWKPSCRLDLH